MISPLAAGVAIACAFALLPRTAVAQATTAERETSRSLMDEGDSFREAGDLHRALERYRAADAIMHVPTTGLEVARAQAQLNHLVDATTTAIEVANSAPGPNDPPLFTHARTAAQAMVEALRPRVPSLTLKVEPIGVIYELRLDSALVPEGAHGLPYKLDPGEHVVLVQAPGYRPISERITLAESQRIERTIRLVSTKPPPRLESSQSAAVKPRDTNIAVRYQQAELDADTAGRTRGYVALGTGGAVLVAGIVTGIVAVGLSEDAKEKCSGQRCPASAEPAIDRANTLANVSNVMLPLGAVGVAYGLFELLTHLSDDAETARRSAPTLAISPTSVSIRGRL
ncbi:MAG TPA: PEGA domain-containing protein [Polyangiales bacterium]|nr:PEGA domain-containing protein [Polyangiales bacterium]